MTKQEKLNTIFDQTRDDFTTLLQGLTEDELIDKAKEKATEALTSLKEAGSHAA